MGDYTDIEPKLLALDAAADCTAILSSHEAVTGTRNGELVVWSMRTGKPLRQLVSPAERGRSLNRSGEKYTLPFLLYNQ